MCKEIVTKDGKTLKPDKLMNYGDENDYVAFVGDAMYVKCENNTYEMLGDKKV
jgi:hypothetical protein